MPPQRQAERKRDIKGTLPTPRNIFHRRAPDRTDPNYLAATTPEPKNNQPTVDDRTAWKRRLAAARRTNLREGILELHKRKIRQDSTLTSRSTANRTERERRLRAPQREDDRLTSPTVSTALENPHIGLPDPDRETRIAMQAERTKEMRALKQEERKYALHTLYMHAREFITTEEQLEAEIQKIFIPSPFGRGHEGKTSIWDAYGAPPTVEDMLSEVNRTQKTAIDFHKGPAPVTGRRMKRIAEELTGGKMD
jgi:hypothetical protein